MRKSKRHPSSEDPISGCRGIVIGMILGTVLWAIVLTAVYYIWSY